MIKISSKRDTKPEFDYSDLGFGTKLTDKMFIMKYTEDKGWTEPEIKDFTNLDLSPAALVFHYGQEIFEGQKAYKWEDGTIAIFRPEMNIKRFNRSAERMCMPTVDEDLMLEAIKGLVWEDRNWIPTEYGSSLYIRPFMIAVDPNLGVKKGKEYIFCIIHSPVGHYFQEGYKPVNILVTNEYVRASIGGVGEAKTGGNYAASIKAMQEANKKGFAQILWLDSRESRYVEEVGTMNICFIENGKLITPELSGSILHGVTRDSVITVARDMGIIVEEKRICIDVLCNGIDSGSITECFGCGTACVISPVGELHYKGKSHKINNGEIGSITQKMYDAITGIQYGKQPDKYNWITKVTGPCA